MGHCEIFINSKSISCLEIKKRVCFDSSKKCKTTSSNDLYSKKLISDLIFVSLCFYFVSISIVDIFYFFSANVLSIKFKKKHLIIERNDIL